MRRIIETGILGHVKRWFLVQRMGWLPFFTEYVYPAMKDAVLSVFENRERVGTHGWSGHLSIDDLWPFVGAYAYAVPVGILDLDATLRRMVSEGILICEVMDEVVVGYKKAN